MRGLLSPARAGGLVLVSCLASLIALLSPSVVLAEGVCPNEAFRVGAGAGLPDCRAYEMVTPVYKNSGDVTGESAIVFFEPSVSSDGQSLVIDSTAGFAGAVGNTSAYGSPYLLGRTGAGWLTTPLESPESQFSVFNLPNVKSRSLGGSVDGRVEMVLAHSVSRPSNSIEIYRVGADGSILEVGPVLPPSTPSQTTLEGLSELESVNPVGVSADGAHVFFRLETRESGSVLWPFDTTNAVRKTLYEYSGTGNTTPMLVGVNDQGELISKCGTNLGGAEGPNPTSNGETLTNHNAISANGATVFFTSYACEKPVNEVYARIDNGLSDAHTVAISEPTKEDCEPCNTTSGLANALFEGASADGSKVFFTTTQPLLGGDGSPNIYEYDFAPPPGQPKIIRVSGGDSTVSNPTAGVVGEPVQISEDGSRVYFVANGVLTTTPNSQGQGAQSGALNLYVFERDARYPAGRTAFIATLSPADGQLWSLQFPEGANTTPDGRFLVFTSVADLTPDDTSSVEQIFEYDSQTGSLVRVSIGQDGFNDNGNTSVYRAVIPSPNYKNWEETADPRAYWSHMAVSADGSKVFFTSRDALTPSATSPTQPGFGPGNVYEYHDGNVYLIAKASNPERPLIGTDVSGVDVFFNTTEQLVGQDTDTNGDIYDARVGGGFPTPVTASGCSGDTCQGALGAAPVLLSPGSEFQAGGNSPLTGSQPSVRSVSKKKPKPKARKRKARRRRRARKAERVAGVRTHSEGGRR